MMVMRTLKRELSRLPRSGAKMHRRARVISNAVVRAESRFLPETTENPGHKGRDFLCSRQTAGRADEDFGALGPERLIRAR